MCISFCGSELEFLPLVHEMPFHLSPNLSPGSWGGGQAAFPLSQRPGRSSQGRWWAWGSSKFALAQGPQGQGNLSSPPEHPLGAAAHPQSSLISLERHSYCLIEYHQLWLNTKKSAHSSPSAAPPPARHQWASMLLSVRSPRWLLGDGALIHAVCAPRKLMRFSKIPFSFAEWSDPVFFSL